MKICPRTKAGLLVLSLILSIITVNAADTLQVCSPSGRICVKVWMGKQLTYNIVYDRKPALDNSFIDLVLDKNRSLSLNNGIRKSSVKEIREQIISPVPEKRRIIPDIYNILSIEFRQPLKVEFRAYDDGVAYRISTFYEDSVYVENEVARFTFQINDSVYFPEVHKKSNADIFHTSYEELYPLLRMKDIPDTVIAFSPVLVVHDQNPAIAITESDLHDYPGMFLKGTAKEALEGIFAPYPLEEKDTKEYYSQLVVTRRAPYIAHTRGTRSFPWRVLMIAPEDKNLPGNDMVYRLAEPSRVKDVSWVHPGKCTDEWIVNINLFNVDFKAGLNTNSYKYYIDFAKRFGFDRIMMDAGWSDNNDLFKINPDINVDTIAAYAKARNIKLSMWTLALTLNRQLDSALNQFNKWGVDFIMTDFIDRDDQKTINFYTRIAEACATHKMMIMYHGAYPPKGFNRTYPNAITREGVLGSEYDIWSTKVTPGHDLILPFTRMLAGSFDYEPGLLNNATIKGFRNIEGMPMSQGTRCHQLAMFVVYDSPMQIFSGNPSQGSTEPEFMNLLGSIPTGWDQTIITDAKIGKYIVTIRKKNDEWFAGGLTDWTPRDLVLPLDFLSDGVYNATICKDGVNAENYAADYQITSSEVTRKTILHIHLAPGGGFLIRLTLCSQK
jgi:alpha-glucosidase